MDSPRDDDEARKLVNEDEMKYVDEEEGEEIKKEEETKENEDDVVKVDENSTNQDDEETTKSSNHDDESYHGGTDEFEVFEEHQLRSIYEYVPKNKTTLTSKLKESVGCSGNCVVSFIFGLFPIITWLPQYSVRNYLPGDVIGGLTTAVVRIPQSLAYGLLAGVQPINGLYTAFFAPLTYAFLGTSKHVSVGTFAIMSLMLESAVEEYELLNPMTSPHDVTSNETTTMAMMTSASLVTSSLGNSTSVPTMDDVTEQAHIAYRLQVVTSLTCLIGIFQILLGCLKMGFVSLFLSDPLVSAFTCASAFHVFTTQIKAVFGITVPRQSAPFAIVKTYIELFSQIRQANVTTIIVSIISVSVLYPIKLININYKEKLRNIPIPIELFVVVIATVVSGAIDLSGKNNVAVVGLIKRGLPAPMVPDVTIWSNLASSAFSIAVVGFAMTVSLGKLFAKKHNYQISPNHEFFALGASQIVCSFFQGHACAGALARSSVKESAGTKTQLSDFVSCAVLLLVLLVFGPYLAPLPKTCLACIIIVNLRSLFLQFKQLPRLWKLSKFDFFIWIVTFLGTLLLGVDTGLFVGIVFLLSSVVLRIYHPDISVHGQLGQTQIYRDVSKFQQARKHRGIRIIRFSQSPFFANKETIQQLQEDLVTEIKAFQHEVQPDDDRNNRADSLMKTTEFMEENGVQHVGVQLDVCPQFHSVIFDCAAWSIIDIVGMEAVKQLCTQITARGVGVYLVNLDTKMVNKFVQIELIKWKEDGDTTTDDATASVKVYPSIHLAVNAASSSTS